jgi:ribosome biogenesis GTPase
MTFHSQDDQPGGLESLGWDAFFQDHFRALGLPDATPGRVVSESKGSFRVAGADGEVTATVAGRLRYRAGEEERYPVVGDWVAVQPLPGEDRGILQAVLPRRSRFSRKAAGPRTEEQIVAANVDTVFIVNALDGGRAFNVRRIERYLTLAWSSGAFPVLVLNKIDLCPDVPAFVERVEAVAAGVPVCPVSALEKTGLDALRDWLKPGETVAFLGSSGVGKSALINALLGEERLQTGEIRGRDHTGRHTTTRRELLLLPGGGVVIDTPGRRELQLWAGEDDLDGAFRDIEELARDCRFSDCRHAAEAGCAVKTAIDRGELDPARLASYRKLQKELRYTALKEENGFRRFEKERWKNRMKGKPDWPER